MTQRLIFTAVMLVQFSALTAAQTKPANAEPQPDRCVFPAGLGDEISKSYPGTRLVKLADLNDGDRKYFVKDHGTRCPGLVRVNFYGDGKPTWALILTPGEENPRRKVQLVVARQTGTTWEAQLIDTTDGRAPVLWRQPPGRYQDIYGQKTIRAKWPVFVFCGYSSWAVLYSWTGKRIDKVWLSD